MNRIAETFERMQLRNESALVGFVTAGDPDRERSLKIVRAMCANGLDILELGVPFSDPTADGPVIQRASERALRAGMTLKGVLEMVRRVRKFSSIPVIVFSYYNPLLACGAERFYFQARAAGADGVLVVDLPPEESEEFTAPWPGSDLSLIRLIAPTTPVDRMARIANGATGFLYLVSKTGVTGSDGLDITRIAANVARIRRSSGLPICVGFGIGRVDQVAAVAAVADGVVIGSAFERAIEEGLAKGGLAAELGRRTAAYKAATRQRFVA